MEQTNHQKYRRPGPEDLSPRQQGLYQRLPKEFREEYLATLPDVKIPTPTVRRKIEVLQQRVDLVEKLIDTLRLYAADLKESMGALAKGSNQVDLRQLLAPPTVCGAILRFTRKL